MSQFPTVIGGSGGPLSPLSSSNSSSSSSSISEDEESAPEDSSGEEEEEEQPVGKRRKAAPQEIHRIVVGQNPMVKVNMHTTKQQKRAYIQNAGGVVLPMVVEMLMDQFIKSMVNEKFEYTLWSYATVSKQMMRSFMKTFRAWVFMGVVDKTTREVVKGSYRRMLGFLGDSYMVSVCE
jgi:hypothetical protein